MKMGPSQTASAAGVSRLDLSLVTSLKLSISASAFETPPFAFTLAHDSKIELGPPQREIGPIGVHASGQHCESKPPYPSSPLTAAPAARNLLSNSVVTAVTMISILVAAMRWNIGWFILLLLAGPTAWLLCDLIQPSTTTIALIFFVIPFFGLCWYAFIGILRLLFTPWGKIVGDALNAIIEEEKEEEKFSASSKRS
ncbi:hypothetical protein [Desulfobulbus elongatus]|uniref:hypothetical protein n=1 Tax=Desulfobulbus elongatus TaxID=53332 RepID=UPI0012FCDC53|nr:hypothetical protein [Desulfobulbus elongatus]